MLMPARISVLMSRSRSCRSRSVVEKAPTRVLRTTMSPGSGATRSSIAVAGELACSPFPRAATAAPIALVAGSAARSASSKPTRTYPTCPPWRRTAAMASAARATSASLSLSRLTIPAW